MVNLFQEISKIHFQHFGFRQNGHHFAVDTFIMIFLTENCCILFQFSLNFVLKWPIYNKPALVRIMAWHQTGGKPRSELTMTLFIDAYMGHSVLMG